MKTIFCLVSRQAMANVLPVLMFQPKSVVLFTTPEEKQCADNLEKLFRSKGIKIKRNDGLNAYDYIKFKDAVKSELEKTEGDVILNVTGGTKLMALAAYEAFAEKDKKIFYCNTENKQIIHLFPKLSTEPLTLSLSVKDYLISYGYEITSTKTEGLNENHKRLFNLLIKEQLLTKFSEFLDKFRSESANKRYLKTYNDKKNRIFSIQKTHSNFILFVGKEKFNYDDDAFLRGEWLEYFMLYSLKNQNINPEVGVKILSGSNVENEIDIIFIKDYQLHLISCKSGRQSDPNRDIYEIETLRNVAGGTFGRGFLVTTQDLSNRIRKRAEDLGIRILRFDKLTHKEFI